MTPDEIKGMENEERVARGMKMADEFYEFFRLGGAFGWKEFQRLDSLQKGACALAKKKIKEEEARFNMKCMMAVFESAVVAMAKSKEAPQPEVAPDAVPVEAKEACSASVTEMLEGSAQ